MSVLLLSGSNDDFARLVHSISATECWLGVFFSVASVRISSDSSVSARKTVRCNPRIAFTQEKPK